MPILRWRRTGSLLLRLWTCRRVAVRRMVSLIYGTALHSGVLSYRSCLNREDLIKGWWPRSSSIWITSRYSVCRELLSQSAAVQLLSFSKSCHRVVLRSSPLCQPIGFQLSRSYLWRVGSALVLVVEYADVK